MNETTQISNDPNLKHEEIATLGGGCFWCTEAVFLEIQGVLGVESGYAGGRRPNPSYEQICSGATGHAEVIQLRFDPQEISYKDILSIFFATHDPTTLNRQGNDVGTQYRSVIFYHDESQKAIAEALIKELDEQSIWPKSIVTELSPYNAFYKAEAYHQNYYQRNTEQGYCQFIISPKVAKLRQQFAHRLKSA
ncbi:MAG: peptide-methionine (S)-S-oxide reductase MsrA [Deinococcales bacterium]